MDGMQGMGAGGQASGGRRWSVRKPRRPRGAASPQFGEMLEYLRWANVMVRDHDLLRQLLQRFACSDLPRERALLLRLALEFDRAHQDFEGAWLRPNELQPLRLELDALRQRLDAAATGSAGWNAAAAQWAAAVLALMQREETCFDLRRNGAPAPHWDSETLEARVALIGEVNAALAMEGGHGHA